MGKPVVGEVVVLPFPQTDLQPGKRRPALVVADLSGDDVILLPDNHSVSPRRLLSSFDKQRFRERTTECRQLHSTKLPIHNRSFGDCLHSCKGEGFQTGRDSGEDSTTV